LNAVLVDTSAIVASLDRSERFHEACTDAIAECSTPLITCEAVIAESCHLVRHLKGAAEAVLANVAAGIFQIPLSLTQSAEHVSQLMRKYADQNIDLADACLIHLASEFRVPGILTLDHGFEHYRWGKNNTFSMLIRRHGK
jgi:predicted nucleic acid-binding protein